MGSGKKMVKMSEHNVERINFALKIRNDLAQEQTLSAVQARSFVRCIQTSWDVETIKWKESDSSSILKQARNLIRAGKILLNVEEGDPNQAALAFQRAGELFEWLARAKDTIGSEIPTALFAAGCYQLGGLPAMASGVLRQISFKDKGAQLFSKFLRADFDGVLSKVERFWGEHTELTLSGVDSMFFGEDSDESLSWFSTVELVRCIGLASQSLRQGDFARFEVALERLKEVEDLLLRTTSDDIALLAFFLRSSCEKFGESTIYKPLRKLGLLNEKQMPAINAFARKQFARGRGILWQSQKQGIEKLINNSSFALCTPTGSGKTLVANLAILKELLILREEGGPSPLALYLVPSRALAGEVEMKLASELGKDFVVTGLYGGTDWGITDAWLTSEMPTVLIATIEKADAIMRYLGSMLLYRLKILILDEAHQVVLEDNSSERENLAGHTNRAIRIESFISRILARKPEIVRIALTAVAGGAAHPVARWIESNEDAEPVGSRYRSARQAIGVLEVTNSLPRISLHRLNDHPLHVSGQGDVYIHLRIPPMPQPVSVIKNSLNHFTQNSILWTALHLSDGNRRILISITQKPEVTMGWYADAFDLPGWDDLSIFEPPEEGYDAKLFEEAKALCKDYCGETSYEFRLLVKGIATSHGQMPQRLRRVMVSLIDRSICPVTIATATLTEGVNLPFDIIFLPLLKRTSFDADRRVQIDHPMSVAEFRNLAGRAGRPGSAKGMEGLTLVALPLSPSTTAAGTLSTQKRQVRDRKADYDNLLQKLSVDSAGETSSTSPLLILLKAIYEQALDLPGINDLGDFLIWLEQALPEDLADDAGQSSADPQARLADSLDELDSMLLSAIEEFQMVNSEAYNAADIEKVISALWMKTFAQVSAAKEAWMEKAFIKRGTAIVETVYPDADERKRLYDYSYTPCISRRFEPAAQKINTILGGTSNYAELSDEQKLSIFLELGNTISDDGGYGFSIRDTAIGKDLYDNWPNVLGWWMQAGTEDGPKPSELRHWQTFVSDNLDFRLGIAIGAVVARAWSEGVTDEVDIPSLDNWKQTTNLPWFAFWAKELLRWGTLEPFVAFSLSLGISKSRAEAKEMQPMFLAWLGEQDIFGLLDGEDKIDPRNFLKWQRSLVMPLPLIHKRRFIEVRLTGTDGRAGRYSVIPVLAHNRIHWLDASGFELAISIIPDDFSLENIQSRDYQMIVNGIRISVVRIYYKQSE